MSDPLLLTLAVLTVLLSAFFSGMEIAFLSVNRLRVEVDKTKSGIASKFITLFTSNPDRYIATMLIGNNVALVVYGLLFAKLMEPYISQYIESEIAIGGVNLIISTIIILIFAEFIPKTLFRVNQSYMLRHLSIPAALFYFIFYPIASFTLAISNLLLRKVLKRDFKGATESVVFGRIDLDAFVTDGDVVSSRNRDSSVDQGVKMFKNALDFSKVRIRECMVPRTDLISIDVSDNIDDLRDLHVNTGFSKIVVYNKSIDEVIGCAYSSDLFSAPTLISDVVRPIKFVPETMEASKLLKIFMKERRSIAIVVDEFGGTSGIVTNEDILEEIFGDIEDEHDKISLVEERDPNGGYLFSGRIEIDYINENYGLNLEIDEGYETLAGLILYNYESIPVVDSEIEIGDYLFKIVESSETKITLISVKRKDD